MPSSLLQERRTALISAAVTGKIDVRGLADRRPRLSLHKEISFEDEVCDYLAVHGWLYAEGDAAQVRPGTRACSRRTCWPGCKQRSPKHGKR